MRPNQLGGPLLKRAVG